MISKIHFNKVIAGKHSLFKPVTDGEITYQTEFGKKFKRAYKHNNGKIYMFEWYMSSNGHIEYDFPTRIYEPTFDE